MPKIADWDYQIGRRLRLRDLRVLFAVVDFGGVPDVAAALGIACSTVKTHLGRLFAKTGTINASNALSGYLVAKSGRTLIFSAFANDVPADVRASEAVDAALELVANEN